MSYFAELDEQKVVRRVIVADQSFIDSGVVGDPKNWVETSYDTRGGINVAGGNPLRKNYAGIGYSYDETRDAFIPPKPYNSWILNEGTCQWDAPRPRPALPPQSRSYYDWDETKGDWTLFVKN